MPAVTAVALASYPEPGAREALATTFAPVATANIEATAAPGDSPFRDYRRHYDEAIATGQYLEAETAAKQLIGHMIDAGDHDHGTMADALARLAFAQRQRRLYEPALRNYQAAVELLEDGEHLLSPSLVAPLSALGDTYMATGRAAQALPVYERALHVRHVNDGPHGLGQIGILAAIVTARAESGDAEAALATADRMYYLYARAFSPDSEEVLPALERKARLLNRFDRHDDERIVYRDIVSVIRNRRGEYDLTLLDAYSALGHTYFHDLDEVRFRSEPTTETAETFFRKALEVTEENPEATSRMQAQALLELADHYTLRNVQDKARIHYRRAWRLLSADDELLTLRRHELERTVALVGATLDPHANFRYRSSDGNDSADYKEGYVVARFTVNDRGRVSDVRVADADPENFASMETHVKQALRDLVYRPRYAGGEPVSTTDHLFRHDYLYLERQLAAERAGSQ